MTPTQRSLILLRKLGYLPAVVEKWNPATKVRHDLFGCVDILAIRPGAAFDLLLLHATLAVQTTSWAHVKDRVDKIRAATARVGHGKLQRELLVLPALLAAGWVVHVHGWRKNKSTGKWEARVVNVGLNGET